VRAALARHGLAPAPAGETLSEALGSGAALCRLLNAIAPGSTRDAYCVETSKKVEQMAAVESYLKGCAKLGVKHTFVTNDLHEAKDLKAVGQQLHSLALHIRSVPALKFRFRGPHLGTKKEAETAREAVVLREEVWAKEERRMARERKRIERDLLSEEMEDERQLIEALRRAEEDAIDDKMRAISEAREKAQVEKEACDAIAEQQASPSGFLYKRGGVAKLWRKRYFVLHFGELQYWPGAEDYKARKPPLGSLALANASVRKPTDAKSKGKYQSTCFRVDLDPESQQSAAAATSAKITTASGRKASFDLSFGFMSAKSSKSKSVRGSTKDDEDDEDGAAFAKEKYKYLLAAESAQGMARWMEAIEFWSARHGTAARRSMIKLEVTKEEEAALRAQAKEVPGLVTKYLQDEEEEEEDDDDDEVAELAATEAANKSTVAGERRRGESTAAFAAGAPSEKAELMSWTVRALSHNLATSYGVNTEGMGKVVLAERYWHELETRGAAHDESTRRWLACDKSMDAEAQARLWIECLLDVHLPTTPLQPQLRSGELLCYLVNAIQPGIVAKVAREELLAGMSESRRNARMRENIGQFVDACAELGVPQRELFLTADLFENKNWKAVLRSIHALARLCHVHVEAFQGPHIGRRAAGGAAGASRLTKEGASALVSPGRSTKL